MTVRIDGLIAQSDTISASNVPGDYLQARYDFIAPLDGSVVVSFESVSDGSFGVILDNVTID